jgi:hypothetical protein
MRPRAATRIFDPATARVRNRRGLDLGADFTRRGAIRATRIENTDLMLIDAGRLTRRGCPSLPAAAPVPEHP